MTQPTPALYERIGQNYSVHRKPDPRIAQAIERSLGDAETVLNVGAGTGSYEPRSRHVVALDPSQTMLAQRRPRSAPGILGRAEALPFGDESFDAVLGILTLHHWSDQAKGLRECVRVARQRVVLLTCDPDMIGFWLTNDYLPEFNSLDREQFPSIESIRAAMTPRIQELEVFDVKVPRDCVDGFLGAFWARPSAYLDPSVQRSISSFARCDTKQGLSHLEADLKSGVWSRRYGQLLNNDALDVGYRLVVATVGK